MRALVRVCMSAEITSPSTKDVGTYQDTNSPHPPWFAHSVSMSQPSSRHRGTCKRRWQLVFEAGFRSMECPHSFFLWVICRLSRRPSQHVRPVPLVQGSKAVRGSWLGAKQGKASSAELPPIGLMMPGSASSSNAPHHENCTPIWVYCVLCIPPAPPGQATDPQNRLRAAW